MTDFLQPQEFAVEDIELRTAHGSYAGEGFLDWDPQSGFRLRALLQRGETPFPRSVVTVAGPVITRVRRIRMRRRGYDWALARIQEPSFFNSHVQLDEHIRCVTFRRERPRAPSDGEAWSGTAVLRIHPNTLLPDAVVEQVSVDGQPVRQAFSLSGVKHKADSGLRFIGYRSDRETLQVSWRLPSSEWSRSVSWSWPDALQYALSILTGQQAQLVLRYVVRGRREYADVGAADSPRRLGFLAPLEHGYHWGSVDLARLTAFLASDDAAAGICRHIFDQLADASRQRTWEGKCLLTGTILEAALRNIEGKPFSPGDQHWDLRPPLERFCKTQLGSGWDEMPSRILAAYKSLRHRYAHPDWDLGRVRGREQLRQDMNQLMLLAQFYGAMILALAGFKDLRAVSPMARDALEVRWDQPNQGAVDTETSTPE